MNDLSKVLFNMILPTTVEELSDKRIVRADGDVSFEDGAVLLSANAKISFDTFFNVFSYSKYKTYTTISKAGFKLKLKGECEVALIARRLTKPASVPKYVANQKPEHCGEDAKYEDKTLTVVQVDCKAEEAILLDFDVLALEGEGQLFCKITAGKKGCTLLSGEVVTCAEKTQNAKCGIVICTYRREEFVRANVAQVTDYLSSNPVMAEKFSLFVVDNGNTLDANGDSTPFATIFPNRNLGGSGGFTRGIIEVCKRPEYTHFLLMDDDISFRPEILERIIALIDYAKLPDALAVGGAMLRRENPSVQYELGAEWKETYIKPFGNDYDLSAVATLIANEHSNAVDYNAWWCMCVPVTAVKDHGLPLPLFIKCDDVEYGLRACPEIAVLNGIGVEHESFEGKYSAELEYYIKRNEAIVSALHSPNVGAFTQIKKIIRSVGRQLVYQRYAEVEYVFKAYKHFFKGPSYLQTLDGEKLNKALRDSRPQQYTNAQLLDMGIDLSTFQTYRGEKTKASYLKQVLTLNGYIIPKLFYSKAEREKGRLVDITTCTPKDFYKSAYTLQRNPQTGLTFITRQKGMQVIKAGVRLVGLSLRLIFAYSYKRKMWQDGLARLTSLENWNRLLGL